MIRSIRDKEAWNILYKSKGVKIDVVEALIREQKVIRSAEDKVRNFLRWLQMKAEPSSFSKATVKILDKIMNECKKIIKSDKGK